MFGFPILISNGLLFFSLLSISFSQGILREMQHYQCASANEHLENPMVYCVCPFCKKLMNLWVIMLQRKHTASTVLLIGLDEASECAPKVVHCVK